jgi:hypothetical protein
MGLQFVNESSILDAPHKQQHDEGPCHANQQARFVRIMNGIVAGRKDTYGQSSLAKNRRWP